LASAINAVHLKYRLGDVQTDCRNPADAVTVEPVSTSKFPANREINREFHQIGPLGAILNADARANSEACSEIPYATEQGIISEEQGILAEEQGFCCENRDRRRMRFSVHTGEAPCA
jgi:hypothetical protein